MSATPAVIAVVRVAPEEVVCHLVHDGLTPHNRVIAQVYIPVVPLAVDVQSIGLVGKATYRVPLDRRHEPHRISGVAVEAFEKRAGPLGIDWRRLQGRSGDGSGRTVATQEQHGQYGYERSHDGTHYNHFVGACQ